MPALVGTSGWQYRHWRGRFYPKELPQRAWLDHYTAAFRVVEVNNSFYMLPKRETFESWAKRTPEDFVLAVKANRYITHIKRLRDAGEAIDRFLEHARHLGSKLGPVLLQLPPNLKLDIDSLAGTLERFPEDVRVAVEFRHESWWTNEVKDLLTEKRAALCMADRASKPITPLWRTADWTYLRFHHGRALPLPCYGRTALKSWAERLAERWAADEDVYVFFNNDPEGCAVRDAVRFGGQMEKVGFETSRVPEQRIRVGPLPW